MKYPSACLIGCLGLLLAGLFCLFAGMNPDFTRPDDSGAVGEIRPAITSQLQADAFTPEKNPPGDGSQTGDPPGSP